MAGLLLIGGLLLGLIFSYCYYWPIALIFSVNSPNVSKYFC